MKIKETADMDATDPLLYTGPSKVDPKTGAIISDDEDDDDRHDASKVKTDELVMSPQAKLTALGKATPKTVQEWISVSEDEFGNIESFDFGLTKEEAPEVKHAASGLSVSDSYVAKNIGTLSEDRGNKMAKNKILTDTLREVGLKPRLDEKKPEEQKSIKDFMNLGASTIVADYKKAINERYEANRAPVVEEAKPEEKKTESPLKTYFKASQTKKVW